MATIYQVNCGNSFPVSGWESDVAYLVQGINIYAGANAQDNSDVPECPPEVLQDHRWAAEEDDPLTYQFDVSGYDEVDVSLYFAESYHSATGPGWRYFDVRINGALVADNYDVWAQAGARDKGSKLSVPGVDASGGTLTIEVYREQRGPMLSGIIVEGEVSGTAHHLSGSSAGDSTSTGALRVTKPGKWVALYRLNCGNTYPAPGWSDDAPYVKSGGQVYASTEAQNTLAVPECPEDVLKDHRWALSDADPLAYEIPVFGYSVADVSLYFSENFPSFGAGDRVFDVYVQGELVEDDFDVYVAAGGANTGTRLKLEGVDVSGGTLTVEFYRGYHAPMVSGIMVEVEEGEGPPPTPPPPQSDRPQFIIEVDGAGDGTFGLDLSDDVIEASWENGLSEPGALIASAVRATIVLDNTAGTYSPERAEALAGLERGKRLRIRAAWDEKSYTLWTGEVIFVQPDALQYGTRRAVVEAAGWLYRALSQDRIAPPVYVERRAGSLIALLVSRTGIYPPAYPQSWALLDAGQTVFPIAFDDVTEQDTMYGILRRILEGEGRPARLYQTRDGRARFLDRHWATKQTESQFTVNNMMAGMEYVFGETLYNRVAVTLAPRLREIEDGPYDLAQTTSAIRLRAWAGSYALQMRYRDEQGNEVSTTYPINPSPYADYEVNRAADGSGEDITPSIVVQSTHYGTSSSWRLSGWGGQDAYLLPGARQRGWDRVILFRNQTVEAEDTDSQKQYGIHPLGISASLMPDTEVGEQYARHVLINHARPRGEARRLRIKPYRSDDLLTDLLENGPDGQARLTVIEPQTGVDNDYFWVGERWMVRENGRDLDVEMLLEPAGAYDSYMLFGGDSDRSRIESGYVFGY